MRVYGSKDLAGVELASALSGAYTIALGLADGLGHGTPYARGHSSRAPSPIVRVLGLAAGAERGRSPGSPAGNISAREGERSADYVLGRRIADGIVTGDHAKTEGARATLGGLECEVAARADALLQGLGAVLTGKIEPREARS